MLSRVADGVYWMARYLERAENTARLVNANANLVLDLPERHSPGWRPLIAITGAEEAFGETVTADERAVVRLLVADGTNPGSILRSLASARENARTVREVLPREGWEQLNDLFLFVRDGLPGGIAKKSRFDFLRRVVVGCQQLQGLLGSTMSHDVAYDFLRIGWHLERADMTSRIIDVRAAALSVEAPALLPFENVQWMSVLRSVSGYQMYRLHRHVRVRREEVLRFLFQDTAFPRSFYHGVGVVERCLRDLPRSEAPLRLAARTKRIVAEAAVDTMEPAALHRFIDDLQIALAGIHQALAATYFLASPGPGAPVATPGATSATSGTSAPPAKSAPPATSGTAGAGVTPADSPGAPGTAAARRKPGGSPAPPAAPDGPGSAGGANGDGSSPPA